MAELTTLARPYARAAFEYAKAENDLPGWARALKLAANITAEPNISKILASPSLTADQKSAAYIGVCTEDLNTAQQNFVKALAENKRLILLKEILQLFELYKANQEKTVEVDMQTAFAIEKPIEEELSRVLSKKLDRTVSLRSEINKDLIGGVLIRAGDTVIDDSVRGRLSKLAEAMGI